MNKALIFGTGAVGGVYGYILSRTGCQVTAVCRSNYDIVKADGISIRSALRGNQHYRPNVVRTVVEAAQCGPFDFVLACCRALPHTAEKIREAVTPDTAIVLAQKGIAIEEEYAILYPENAIISGVVWLPTTQTSPGVIEGVLWSGLKLARIRPLRLQPTNRKPSTSANCGRTEEATLWSLKTFSPPAGPKSLSIVPLTQCARSRAVTVQVYSTLQETRMT